MKEQFFVLKISCFCSGSFALVKHQSKNIRMHLIMHYCSFIIVFRITIAAVPRGQVYRSRNNTIFEELRYYFLQPPRKRHRNSNLVLLPMTTPQHRSSVAFFTGDSSNTGFHKVVPYTKKHTVFFCSHYNNDNLTNSQPLTNSHEHIFQKSL